MLLDHPMSGFWPGKGFVALADASRQRCVETACCAGPAAAATTSLTQSDTDRSARRAASRIASFSAALTLTSIVSSRVMPDIVGTMTAQVKTVFHNSLESRQ